MTRLLSIFAAVLGMLVFGETAVEACLCGRGSCGAIATTPVLFEATIVSTEPDPGTGGGTRILRLADVRAIRGPAPQVIELQGSSCDLELAVGQRSCRRTALDRAGQWHADGGDRTRIGRSRGFARGPAC